ncbi:SoxR reducing system RseC family protein [bacterium]|nr:SoxR reducing system RseC family protein [bacterium]
MEEYGQVVDIKGSTAIVSVEKVRTKSCGDCRLCEKGKDGYLLLEATGYEGIQKGDRVKVKIEVTHLLKKNLFLYGLPFVGFLFAVLVARYIHHSFIKTAVFIIVFVSAVLLGITKSNKENRVRKVKITKV